MSPIIRALRSVVQMIHRGMRRPARAVYACRAIRVSLATLVSLGALTLPAQRTPTTPATATPVLSPSTSALLAALDASPVSDSIRTLIASAVARGVPSEPLITKVREGIAKRSSPVRIRDAVESLSLRLASAREALAPTVSVDEATAGAGAIQAGVAAPVLRDMRRVWPATSLAVPLGVVTELVLQGVKPSQAGPRVRELMVNGAKGAQLVALGAGVREDVASGKAPATAFEARSRSVLSLLVTPTVNSLTQTIRPDRPAAKPPRP